MIELFYLLHIFHVYSKEKDFVYTISSGTILGYISNGSILPGDDDIDIVVPYSHFQHVQELWNNKKQKEKKIWDTHWTYKDVHINSRPLVLLKLKNRNFFKLKLNTNKIEKKNQYQKDIGGLDIVDEHGFHGNVPKSMKQRILGNDDNYETRQLCAVEIKILKKDNAEIFCNFLYRKVRYPRWKEMKHPQLFF